MPVEIEIERAAEPGAEEAVAGREAMRRFGGGRVSSSEQGWPLAGSAVASTSDRLPRLLPP
jgi:hypothetical protein